jgi:hypothetical protein
MKTPSPFPSLLGCLAAVAFLPSVCAQTPAEPATAIQPASVAPTPTPSPQCPLAGWSEGLVYHVGPTAQFPVSDTANNPQTDCAFHQWAWEAFVWATAINTNGGQPRFLSLATLESLGKPAAKEGPNPLALKPRTLKPAGAPPAKGDKQAGGGLLVDQNGQIVWYSVHMNAVYAKVVQQYSGMTNYNKAAATATFPVGSAVFKAAWQVVPDGTPPTGIYWQKTTIPLLVNNPKGGIMIDPSGKTRPVTVALVGLHVVGVTDNHPEFLWATFEHLQNAPDLADPNGYNSPAPVSNKSFTFYAANTPAKACNPDPSTTTLKVTDRVKQTVSATPMTNVFRQYATGGEDAEGTQEIVNTTIQAQGALAQMSQYPKEAVWANYKLIGTTWIQPNTLKPDVAQLEKQAVGSVNLANATLETYFQGPEHNFNKNPMANCFMCHNTGGSTGNPSYPGKDINLSHQLLATLKPSPTPSKRSSPPPKTGN